VYSNLANNSSLVTIAAMNGQTKLIEIPAANRSTIICTQCNASTSVYKVPDSAPHLYCTKCQNVYHELGKTDYEKRFPFASFRKKIMHHIEGNAPICPCGGLFIFNAYPHNPQCLHKIHLPIKMHGNARLVYADMYIFDGSQEFTDGGKTRVYSFVK
jgi:hypothetical protein